MNAIIIGSNPMTRLCLIRSIGEAINCKITVVHMVYDLSVKRSKKPLDCYSKYVSRLLYAQKFNAEMLCALLIKECSDERSKPFLFSVDDDSACLIDTKLNILNHFFICANIRGEQGELARLMNKQLQKELACKFGFDVAKSWVIENRNGKYIIPDDIVFPCFLKGLLSYHTMKVYQRRYDERNDLENSLQVIAKNTTDPFIAEEFIEIEKDLGVIGFCDRGYSVVPGVVDLLDSGHGCHNGVSAFGRVRQENQGEGIVEAVSRFVGSLGLFGLFNIDLVYSKGRFYFVELNLRFAAYGYAVTKAGVNLPALLINRTVSRSSIFSGIGRVDEKYYINERVAIDDMVGGYRSIREYKGLIQKADFGLMRSSDDKKPYRRLILYSYKRFVIIFLKKIMQV